MENDLGRWADPSLLVMTSLAAGPKHGYAIMQDVEADSGVKLGPGTLYGVIARLEERGLIEPLEAQERRRPYRITAEGSRVLATQLERMRAVADTGLGRLADGRVGWSHASGAWPWPVTARWSATARTAVKAVLTRGDDPQEPPAAASGKPCAAVRAVLTRGGDPPEPPVRIGRPAGRLCAAVRGMA